MKWIRRLLIAILLFVIVALIASAMGYRRMHGLPAWYARHSADPVAQAAAANRANQKLAETLTETARLQNAMRHPEAASINAVRGAALPARQEPLGLILSDDEINAFFDSWDRTYHWSDRYSRYLTDPQIILSDGHIILAASSTELETIVSVHFAPSLKDGMLQMPVVSVMAGNLPLPRTLWNPYRAKLLAAVERQLPASTRLAQLHSDGSANSEMVDAFMGRLLVQILNDRPADPIFFLPYLQSMKRRYLPVKLTGVTIENATMQLRFVPLSEAERQAMAASIRQSAATVGVADKTPESP